MSTFKSIVISIVALLIWVGFIAYGFIDGFLLKPIAPKKNPTAFIEAVEAKIEEEFVGNFALLLIEDGQASEKFFFSVDHPIDENTVFPVASISKWVTSFGILKLVEQAKLDLDQPIDTYLSRWHLPKSEFDNNKVTIRKLLSHSSGLVDGLGYSGFPMNEEVQSIEESLIKAADAPYSEGLGYF